MDYIKKTAIHPKSIALAISFRGNTCLNMLTSVLYVFIQVLVF